MNIGKSGSEVLRRRILLHLKGIEWEDVTRMRRVLERSAESIREQLGVLESLGLVDYVRGRRARVQLRAAAPEPVLPVPELPPAAPKAPELPPAPVAPKASRVLALAPGFTWGPRDESGDVTLLYNGEPCSEHATVDDHDVTAKLRVLHQHNAVVSRVLLPVDDESANETTEVR